MKTFEEVWAKTGYNYGEDALENVKLGWELCAKYLYDEMLNTFQAQLTALANTNQND